MPSSRRLRAIVFCSLVSQIKVSVFSSSSTSKIEKSEWQFIACIVNFLEIVVLLCRLVLQRSVLGDAEITIADFFHGCRCSAFCSPASSSIIQFPFSSVENKSAHFALCSCQIFKVECEAVIGFFDGIQEIVDSSVLPLLCVLCWQIDTANAEALGRALFIVNGKALVNSVNGKQESMDGVFPLVKRYGGTVVALCLDENGIPSTSQGRIDIARRILDEGAKYGLKKKDFVFDALTLAVSADPTAAVVTLETVKRLTEELGVNTVLGVSNVSFGLPNRPALNNAMYALAKRAGLSAAIANPSLIRDEVSDLALDVLLGRDEGCLAWIDACSGGCETSQSLPPQSAGDAPTFETLMRAIEKGLLDDAKQVAAQLLLIGTEPLKIIGEAIVPALENVGLRFEKGEAFLPQLLMAADAAGAAFSEVRKSLKTVEGEASSEKRRAHPIVIATVKGDIHDIGKNIVRALLENYGFDVIDLGRDVEPEKIVETALSSGAFMIGLSALMTTTVGAMGETICLAKERGVKAKFCVGGAVLTQEYASSIGADYYAKDAMRTVRIAEELGDMS